VNSNVWILTFSDAISIATTLILATLGAILTERSGVINLGVEGIMLMGAVTAFLVGDGTGNLWLALFLSVLVGVAMATVHATLTITLRANQIVAGLALVIFGNGLSQFIGKPVEGKTRPVTIEPMNLRCTFRYSSSWTNSVWSRHLHVPHLGRCIGMLVVSQQNPPRVGFACNWRCASNC